MKVTGDAGDISNLCSLGWFEWCYFRDGSPFPYQAEKLGHCLGPAINYSNEMAQWILKDMMKITALHTIRPLTEDEHRDLNLIKERENFMEKCQSYHGNKMKLGNKRMPKVETVLDDDDDTVAHTYFQDKPADKTEMPE